MVVSAVPDGDGSKVLEVGQWVATTRTIKGEVSLPVTTDLAPDALYRKVFQDDRGDRTLCATCHRDEERHPSIANAFTSVAFKPTRSSLVSLVALVGFHEQCVRDNDESSARCAMMHAVFDFGEVTAGAFAAEVETFTNF